jgi:hypothetical protein
MIAAISASETMNIASRQSIVVALIVRRSREAGSRGRLNRWWEAHSRAAAREGVRRQRTGSSLSGACAESGSGIRDNSFGGVKVMSLPGSVFRVEIPVRLMEGVHRESTCSIQPDFIGGAFDILRNAYPLPAVP